MTSQLAVWECLRVLVNVCLHESFFRSFFELFLFPVLVFKDCINAKKEEETDTPKEIRINDIISNTHRARVFSRTAEEFALWMSHSKVFRKRKCAALNGEFFIERSPEFQFLKLSTIEFFAFSSCHATIIGTLNALLHSRAFSCQLKAFNVNFSFSIVWCHGSNWIFLKVGSRRKKFLFYYFVIQEELSLAIGCEWFRNFSA